MKPRENVWNTYRHNKLHSKFMQTVNAVLRVLIELWIHSQKLKKQKEFQYIEYIIYQKVNRKEMSYIFNPMRIME